MKVLVILFLVVSVASTFRYQKPEEEEDDPEDYPEEVFRKPVPRAFRKYNPENDVKFLLFTQKNPLEGEIVIRNNDSSLTGSNFNSKLQTRILIHGWKSSSESRSQTTVRDAYLKRADFNVFIVDWSAGAQTDYIKAKKRVASTGAVVGNFIHFLINSGGANRSDISVIGHSLGAHIAGFAGKNHTHPNQIASIVGLDPAYPFFWSVANDANAMYRLASMDADYVETIHTNAGHLGFKTPIGDASFFLNWGKIQPGCGVSWSCSHARAYEYFAESINTDVHFYAVYCPEGYKQIKDATCPQTNATKKMGGEPLLREDFGVYFLPTSDKSPFAKGKI